ncbi:MAG: hypothetical protein ACRYE9_00260 [Janthinobacterium lividum]
MSEQTIDQISPSIEPKSQENKTKVQKIHPKSEEILLPVNESRFRRLYESIINNDYEK